MLAMKALSPQQKSRVPLPIRPRANRSLIASQWVMVRLTWMSSGATLMIASATSLAAKKAPAGQVAAGMASRIQIQTRIMIVAAHRVVVHVPPFFRVDCLSHRKMAS